MPLKFSKTTCTRQMSVWQTFLKIQSAASISVTSSPSSAGRGRSWTWAWRGRGYGRGVGVAMGTAWAWLWAWPRPWAADHTDQGPPLLQRFWLQFPHPLLTVCSPPQYYQLSLVGDSGRRQSGTEDTNEP